MKLLLFYDTFDCRWEIRNSCPRKCSFKDGVVELKVGQGSNCPQRELGIFLLEESLCNSLNEIRKSSSVMKSARARGNRISWIMKNVSTLSSPSYQKLDANILADCLFNFVPSK